MKKTLCVLFYGLIILARPLFADEGMWLLPLIEKLNHAAMQKQGLALSAEEIYSISQSSLKDAVVIFGGGCTGEIISPEGLLLTNHHCGYGTIQKHSSVEHDYLKDGFWAMTRAEEIPSPGLAVTFLEGIEDVSDKILPELEGITDETQRTIRVNELSGALHDTVTKDRKDIRAAIYPMFNGNAYYLFTYKVYEDVRLVGAPPSAIGKFGSDTDNWMWPRHTGDFSLFRVYTDKNGNPAKYANDNIPLTPKRHLNVSIAGFEEGDYAMVMGYPGSTNRYMTSWEVHERVSLINAIRIHVRGIRQEILLADMLADPKVKIQYAAKYSNSTNYWKNAIGMNEALKRLKVVEKKEATEKQFAEFADTIGNKNYETALGDIRQAIEGRENSYRTVLYYAEIFPNIEIQQMAGRALGYLKALQDTSKKAIAIAKEKLLKEAEAFYKDYSAPTDVKVAKALLKVFAEKVPKDHWPQALIDAEKKYKGNFDKYVDDWFAKSVFVSFDKLKAFTEKPVAKQLDKDPVIQLAASRQDKAKTLAVDFQAYSLPLEKGRRHFLAGLMEMQPDRVFYPDANFSTRLTYGNILSYDPKDAVHYKYYTTLDGVMEKEDPDNWEFVVPEKLKQLYLEKDYGRYALPGGELPVCFLSNNDITGGNSGSPVLNGRGELIGTAFDGNWEALSGDIAFEPDLQRCINVDIRYVLFIIDKYAGATHLLDEMTIVEK
ncbi:MAG: S46 family peptidase [Prevotellaceae bacterium]|jgi:hypothetical protein|nr:S46 family peptidase [Prevotellaceae bacterium]